MWHWLCALIILIALGSCAAYPFIKADVKADCTATGGVFISQRAGVYECWTRDGSKRLFPSFHYVD